MIPFSPPYIDKDIIDEVIDTLKSGWITTGPKVKALEDEIARLSKAKAVICVNSATSGLMLALKWFGIGIGDEVIIPAYTYAATALAVYHIGAKPVLADVNEDFNINIDSIKRLINPSTKAIIPVDIAGWPCDYDKIYELVSDPLVKTFFTPSGVEQEKLGRILILSDAAHSLGGLYKNKPCGSLTDISVFSLHAVKNITTAEGGAICLSLPKPFMVTDEFNKLKLMALNGQTKDAFSKNKSGNWRYDIVLPGYKMNMPDICAAIGLAQIRIYKEILLVKRKTIALQYVKGFENFSWAILPPLSDIEKESSYHLFALRIKGFSEDQRDLMIKSISQQEISVNVHFIPLPMFKFFKEEGYKMEDYPGAYNCFKNEISLPIYPQLDSESIDLIIDVVINSYNKVLNVK